MWMRETAFRIGRFFLRGEPPSTQFDPTQKTDNRTSAKAGPSDRRKTRQSITAVGQRSRKANR